MRRLGEKSRGLASKRTVTQESGRAHRGFISMLMDDCIVSLERLVMRSSVDVQDMSCWKVAFFFGGHLSEAFLKEESAEADESLLAHSLGDSGATVSRKIVSKSRVTSTIWGRLSMSVSTQVTARSISASTPLGG